MKLEEEIDDFFKILLKVNFGYLRNPFTANAKVLQAGTGMQENVVKLQHNDVARDV